MIEAAHIAGWDTAPCFLIEIDGSFQTFRRADKKDHRLITREEAHTPEEKIQAKKRIVVLACALA
jgi:hypothetical protein